MQKKIYIAGKITGDPDYKAKFDSAAKKYSDKGYVVLSPAAMPEGMSRADYMRICLAMIDTADVVAFLAGFRESSGAMIEYDYCNYTDKPTKTPADERYAMPFGDPAAMQIT